MTLLREFKNPEYGLTSVVSEGEKGFHVSLRDDDSGEYLSQVKIFPVKSQAIEHAQALIK